MPKARRLGTRGASQSAPVMSPEPGPPVRTDKERYWRKQIEEQKRSGLSVAQYCTNHGLGASSLQWWIKELRKRDKMEALETLCHGTLEDDSNPFVAVNIGAPAAVVEGGLEIVLPGGATIKVTDGTPMNLLARVLRMLEEGKC